MSDQSGPKPSSRWSDISGKEVFISDTEEVDEVILTRAKLMTPTSSWYQTSCQLMPLLLTSVSSTRDFQASRPPNINRYEFFGGSVEESFTQYSNWTRTNSPQGVCTCIESRDRYRAPLLWPLRLYHIAATDSTEQQTALTDASTFAVPHFWVFLYSTVACLCQRRVQNLDRNPQKSTKDSLQIFQGIELTPGNQSAPAPPPPSGPSAS